MFIPGNTRAASALQAAVRSGELKSEPVPSQPQAADSKNAKNPQKSAGSCDTSQMGRAGIEQTAKDPEKPHFLKTGGAKSDALDAPKPQPAPALAPDLAELVNAWPTLAPAIRAGILAMIQAAKGGV